MVDLGKGILSDVVELVGDGCFELTYTLIDHLFALLGGHVTTELGAEFLHHFR
jgi:hypothetical protein